jgi:hypothetical protein
MKPTKASFIEATKGQWNSVRIWNGIKIASVAWQNNRWKIVSDDDHDIVCVRGYESIAEFHTRNELWNFIKSNMI